LAAPEIVVVRGAEQHNWIFASYVQYHMGNYAEKIPQRSRHHG